MEKEAIKSLAGQLIPTLRDLSNLHLTATPDFIRGLAQRFEEGASALRQALQAQGLLKPEKIEKKKP